MCANFGLKAELNLYLKRARQRGKSLIITSTQRTNFSLMAVLQQTTILRVVPEQQTNTYPQVISALRINSCLMAMLQRTEMPRVVANRGIYLTP